MASTERKAYSMICREHPLSVGVRRFLMMRNVEEKILLVSIVGDKVFAETLRGSLEEQKREAMRLASIRGAPLID